MCLQDLTDASIRPISGNRSHIAASKTAVTSTEDSQPPPILAGRQGRRLHNVQETLEKRVVVADYNRQRVGGDLVSDEKVNRKLSSSSNPAANLFPVKRSEPEVGQHSSKVGFRLYPLEFVDNFEISAAEKIKFPILDKTGKTGSVDKSQSGSYQSGVSDDDLTDDKSDRIASEAEMASTGNGFQWNNKKSLKRSNHSFATLSSNGTQNNENGQWNYFAKPEVITEVDLFNPVQSSGKNFTKSGYESKPENPNRTLTQDSRKNSSSDFSGGSFGQSRPLQKSRSRSQANLAPRSSQQFQQPPPQQPRQYQNHTELDRRLKTTGIGAAKPRTSQNAAGSRVGGLRTSQSHPNFMSQKNLARGDPNDRADVGGDDEGDSETNAVRSERIVKWLMDVNQYGEPPPCLSDIEDEKPPQTDTGIHVVHKDEPEDLVANFIINGGPRFSTNSFSLM